MGAFALGVLGILAALLLPGYLFFRALRFTRLHALVAAPLFSATLYGLLPIVYYDAGISCTVATTFGVALLAGAVPFAVARPWQTVGAGSPLGRPLVVNPGGTVSPGDRAAFRKARAAYGLPSPAGRWRAGGSPREAGCDWVLLALYLACGLLVGCLVFAGNLSTPDAAYIRYDNQTHLNDAKAFLDSGMWSSLHPSRYLAMEASSMPVVSGSSSFYPALLYGLSALCALMAGLSITAAFNAVLFALCFVVFPLGMYALVRAAFPGNRLAVALGAMASISFAAYPWGVMVRGLFPNVAGIALMAPAIGSCMLLLAHPHTRGAIPRCVVLWAFGLPALALAQPNAVFGAFVFLVAYAAHVAGDRASGANGRASGRGRPRVRQAGAGSSGVPQTSRKGHVGCDPGLLPDAIRSRNRQHIVAILAVAALGLAVWTVALNLPALHSVVHYFGNTIQGRGVTLQRVLLLRFDPFKGQWLLALVVVAGVVNCIRKRTWWLLFPAAWMAIAYFLIRTANTPAAHFLAGFWYCDHVRIAAFYSVFLMPIAAAGFSSIARGAWLLAGRTRAFARPARQAAVSAAAIGLCALCIFFPNVQAGDQLVKTGFGTVYTELHNMYGQSDDRVYGSDEQAFVDEARQITGDALVLNYPADGSSFAYAVNDMNVYYRAMKTKNFTDAAKEIRLRLADYATDSDVRAAVESTGARYLLRLDQGVAYEDGTWFRQFRNPGKWKGIEAVDETTPGFTVVLTRGDMVLYRIEPIG